MRLLQGGMLAVAMTVALSANAAGGAAQSVPGSTSQSFSGPREEPRRHLRFSNAVGLSPAAAETVYQGLLGDLAERYGQSGDAAVRDYQSWQRYNTAPYTSMTHGRRYVNNYANDVAAAYGLYEAAGRLPVGSLLAKDSFVVLDDGEILPGPLFVMEKMPAGFNYLTGDWRYSMITPQGEVAGRTLGFGAERVEFCIACHLARESQDHLYFLPPEFRVTP